MTYRPSIIPADAREVYCEGGVVYLWEKNDRFQAIGVKAKAKHNTAFNFYFRTEDHRTKYVNEWIDNQLAYANAMAKRKADRKVFQHTLQVGDVLRTCWGYEQTNIDYYEVTKVLGKMVEIREIGQHREETMWAQGDCVPAPGHYIGQPMRKAVTEGNNVKIASYAWASKVEPLTVVAGKPIYGHSHYTAYH